MNLTRSLTYKMVKKSVKTLIKASVFIIVILLIVGAMALIVKNVKTSKIDQNNTIQEPPTYKEQSKITWEGAILIFLIFIIVIGILRYVIKKSPDFYKLLKDEEVIEESRRILSEIYNFGFENKKGSVIYYLSYYNGGDKRYPRATIGWNLKQRHDSEGSIEPINAHIVSIDISRRNTKYDHQFLGSLTKDEALKYLHDIQFGKIGQSVDPIKQQKIILSEAEQEAIEEVKKEKIKEEIKKK